MQVVLVRPFDPRKSKLYYLWLAVYSEAVELIPVMWKEVRMRDDNRECLREFDLELLKILVCPKTKQPLEFDEELQELISPVAKLAYPIRDGIPILLIDEARSTNSSDNSIPDLEVARV